MSIDGHLEESFFARALEQLAEVLVAEESLSVVLDRVIALARDAISGCDLASVTWMSEQMFETVAFSHPDALVIDEAQYTDDRGPCLFAYRRREVASVPSMSEGDSWAAFRLAAIARDVRSSFSLPMAIGEVRVGALNLYSRTDNGFDAVPPAAALLFAKQAAAAIVNARTSERTRNVIEHLETALASREVIGMAKGIVMANEKIKANEAFDLLVRASQNRNEKLRDLAAEVVESGATPTDGQQRNRP
jgi:GAF domain-containing protein